MIVLDKREPDYKGLYRCPCCDTVCIDNEDQECPNCQEVIEWEEEPELW